jgi:drug/metabolite transporter (DMT)-like permease
LKGGIRVFQAHIGELAALTTAICWVVTALAFESAGKKVGSLSVNLIRLLMAFVFISFFNLYNRGLFLPTDATSSAWIWLSVSGLIGFVIGDLFLFQAYVLIGSRISQLIMSTVPPMTAITGFFLMGETITALDFLGMVITICGIAIVILTKGEDKQSLKLSHSVKGLTYAFIGAVGQAFGLVFSKYGMQSYDPFAATQIRIIIAIVGFIIVISVLKKWKEFLSAFKDRKSILHIGIGSVFGPFIGVSLSLLAAQHTATGIVATITSITPILIIPPAIILFKEKISTREIIGAVISLIGIILLFI